MTRHISRAVVLVFCAMSGAASAQVAMGAAKPPGVRISPAAPKPEAPIRAPALSEQSESKGRSDHGVRQQFVPGKDVFRARPDTYVPRRIRQISVPYVVTERVVEPIVIERTRVVEVEKPAREERVTPVEPPAVVAPTRVFIPAPPKTLYVIPRCYAGDKIPDPKLLPDGCDARNIKVIRPGV